ncbi:MAG: nucleotidyltransferase family protein [Gammaproteobacteria bacterium]|nr:nucleotidyltransferase family protein [Gammaproteobacteria bacterium]
MPAMLLAAGRGKRMRPLTDHLPKALLPVGDKTLIEHHLLALAKAGIDDIVINTSYLGSLLREALADGDEYGVHIRYSDEGNQPLETAGGIANALPMLGEKFLVINADIWTDFEFDALRAPAKSLAHLVLVDNPPHHPDGDFALLDSALSNQAQNRLTYAGIGVFRAELFADLGAGAAPLAPLLRHAADAGHATGEHYQGDWLDVGTPQRLAQLCRRLAADRMP